MQILSIIIFIGSILLFTTWQKILFNILFLSYYLVGEDMQNAIILFALIMRVIFYPLRVVGAHVQEDIKIVEKKIDDIKKNYEDPVEQKRLLQKVRHDNGWAFNFILFNFLFLLITALGAARIFYNEFTPDYVLPNLFPFIPEPAFPVNTLGYLPIIGEIDYSLQNNVLNLTSAVGLGILGIMEVIVHNRTGKREVLLYIVGYPLGGYLITSNVPSGFEFFMTMVAVLSLVVLGFEKVQFLQKNKKK